jgi:hypothetical protein
LDCKLGDSTNGEVLDSVAENSTAILEYNTVTDPNCSSSPSSADQEEVKWLNFLVEDSLSSDSSTSNIFAPDLCMSKPTETDTIHHLHTIDLPPGPGSDLQYPLSLNWLEKTYKVAQLNDVSLKLKRGDRLMTDPQSVHLQSDLNHKKCEFMPFT